MKPEKSNEQSAKTETTVQPDPDAKEQDGMYYSPAEETNDLNEIKASDDLDEPDPEDDYDTTEVAKADNNNESADDGLLSDGI